MGIVILLVVYGGFAVYKNQKDRAVGTTGEGPTKNFTVVGTDYSFSPAAISVKKGDTVNITFTSNDGYHDLMVDGYNVSTERVNTNGKATVSFVADKAGSFSYYCTVGSHRDKGMNGTLVVTE